METSFTRLKSSARDQSLLGYIHRSPPTIICCMDLQGRMLVYLFLGLLMGRSAASCERSIPTLFSSYRESQQVVKEPVQCHLSTAGGAALLTSNCRENL